MHTSKPEEPETVSEYIASAPREARANLSKLRSCIRAAAPGAMEGLQRGMPTYSQKRTLVTFAACGSHINFYPTQSVVRAFVDELSDLVSSSGSIQFPLDQPLPLQLIGRITAFRVRECLDEDKRKRTS